MIRGLSRFVCLRGGVRWNWGDSELQQMRQSQDFRFPEIGISVVNIPFFRIKKNCWCYCRDLDNTSRFFSFLRCLNVLKKIMMYLILIVRFFGFFYVWFICFCLVLSTVFNMSLWLGRLSNHFRRLWHKINYPILSYPQNNKYSWLSLDGHLYKKDASVKQPIQVGNCLSLLPPFDSL